MGGTQSEPASFPALPQQQIINVTDGNEASVQGGAAAGNLPRVGTSKQAVAVKQPITLAQGGLKLLPDGSVSLDLNAMTEGTVEMLHPAIERTNGALTWPSISADTGKPWRRTIPQGNHVKVHFNDPEERLSQGERLDSAFQNLGDDAYRWPLLLLLQPRCAAGAQDAMDPPNGTTLVCCIVENQTLKVARRIVAWGGSAHEIQDLFGLQDARQAVVGTGTESQAESSAEVENQKNCVVCLTVPRDTALMPCGHFCACYDCARSMRLAPARNRCPLCRKEIHDIVHIDVTAEEVDAPGDGVLGSAEDVSTARAVGPVVVENAVMQDVQCIDEVPVATHTDAPSVATPESISMEEVRAKRLRALGVGQDNSAEEGGNLGASTTAATGSTSSPVNTDSSGLPPRCLQRLMREFRALQEQAQQHLAEHALQISLSDPEGNDLRTWSLRLFTKGVDDSCELGKQLRARSIEAVDFEIWIPNAFPVQPPLVRVMAPTFNTGSFWVQAAGALCLEALTKHGWTPAMSLPQLGVHIKTMMSQGNGVVSGPGAMGQPGPAGREQALAAHRRIESAHNDWNPFSGKD